MAFWDELFKRVRETAEETERALKQRAGRAAARETLAQLKGRAEAAVEDLVSAAERELEAEEAARGGAPASSPPGTAMDAEVQALIQGARDLERQHREARLRALRRAAEPDEGQIPAPPPRRGTLAEQRAEREASARAQLEALKARLGRGGERAGGGGDGVDGEPDDLPERTL